MTHIVRSKKPYRDYRGKCQVKTLLRRERQERAICLSEAA
ncbi:hypothetical protein BN133_1396 [Cronobacter dublinensis 582]|nr:hypothetical protein BN133_1396 [Cronobacter dublinensis 582]